ncbi:hypothetical protein MCEMSE15_00224 [Fimbriimonadaceae bacterium]
MAQQKLDLPSEPIPASSDISVALKEDDVPSTAETPAKPKPSEDWKAFWKPTFFIFTGFYVLSAAFAEYMYDHIAGTQKSFDYLGKFLLIAGLMIVCEWKRRKGVFDFATEEWTSKPSELPRLLEKAKQVAVLAPHDESEHVNAWSCLSYLSKKLHPHHKPHFDEAAVASLKHLLSTETLPERQVVLIRLAITAADSKLLSELKALQLGAGERDPNRKFADQIALAIEACSKVEPKSVRAIGGLAK